MSSITSNMDVLIVSGSNGKSRVIKDVLAAMGIVGVGVTRNYISALRTLKKKKISLLLVEMYANKSSISTVEFISAIRQDVVNFVHIQDIPIIVYADNPSREEVEKLRDAGMTEFIIYPFSVGHLNKLIEISVETPRKMVVERTYVGPDRRRQNSKIYPEKERRKNKETD